MSGTESTQPEDYQPTPEGWAKRWKAELDAARKEVELFQQRGRKVVEAFLDERGEVGAAPASTKWNLFHSGITNMQAMLYGNTPKADVARRFADSEDDVARIAGEMGERLLHTDLERRSDTAAEAFGEALEDWLLPGLGTVRVRYAFKPGMKPGQPAIVHPLTGAVQAEAVPEVETRLGEEAHVDYVHWQDFLWSPCRVWSQVTWVAFGADMGKAAFVKRFDEDTWKLVRDTLAKEKDDDKPKDPWARVRVWEIWHREAPPVDDSAPEDEAQEAPGTAEVAEGEAPEEKPAEDAEGQVFWYVEGYGRVLDMKPDPYGLEGFFPCPRPLVANPTTTKFIPRADYYLAQDLYLSINARASKIKLLEQAVKAAGGYDDSSTELVAILSETVQNRLLPVSNWGKFTERGGIQGAMQFLPIDIFVAAIQVLQGLQQTDIDMLYQVTGQADIMRGQATVAGASATESAVKARFGSVRMQRRQDEFARFVSEAQALKLELICKHFLPESILEKCNAQYAFKADEAATPGITQQAVQLLKSDYSCYRVAVKPESISLTDFAQLKQDRMEVVGGLAQFMTAAAPLLSAAPDMQPFLLQLLQDAVAGLKGSSTMEGTIDAAIQSAKKKQEEAAANPQQAPQDPRLQAEQVKAQTQQMKGQADLAKEQMKHQNDLERIAAETQAHDAQEQSQARWNTRETLDKQLISNALKPKELPKPGGFALTLLRRSPRPRAPQEALGVGVAEGAVGGQLGPVGICRYAHALRHAEGRPPVAVADDWAAVAAEERVIIAALPAWVDGVRVASALNALRCVHGPLYFACRLCALATGDEQRGEADEVAHAGITGSAAKPLQLNASGGVSNDP
jgi:hypothetical protein